jgi:5-methylcytosine-specific restriction endonuclease McrA
MVCVECSVGFEPASWQQRFCGPACRLAFWGSRSEPLGRVCVECGEAVLRRGPGVRCTPCGDARRFEKRPPRYRRVVVFGPRCRVVHRPKTRVFVAGECPCCGGLFVALASTGARFCSAMCQKRVERQQRRARKVAAEKSVPIFRRKVFERDDWTCRICRKPVQQGALVPHPKAPTVDHILPLALGGSHTYLNVQTAHFICNSTKSANVVQLSFAA